jgi:autotransporter-associated beta strand protein
MRVKASLVSRFSLAAKRHVVLLGLSLLLLRPDAALSEIVFSGDRNIAIPTDFDGVYINISNGQFGSSPVAGWDLNPFFGGLFIANSPNFQPVRIGDGFEDAIIRLAPTSVIGGGLTYSSDWGGSGAEGGQGHLGSGLLQFADGKSGYLGFKLLSEAADPRYGWMQVVLTENGENGRIQSWAYENSGGTILAGATGQSGQRVVTGEQGTITASTAGNSILLGVNGKITFEESGAQGSFSGKIEGNGEIMVTGAGGLRLSGSNSFSGTASVLEGSKLTITTNENLGSATVKLGTAAALVFDSSAIPGSGGNTFANNIILNPGAATLRNSGDGVVEITGVINGSGTLIKDGAGDLNITGNNGYTGNTLINDGKLVVNGDISSSLLTIVHGGGAIGGSGAIGALTVNTGALITPGNSPGNMTVNGGFTMAGEYEWDLASLSTDGPGTNYDTVTITVGNVVISSATLSLNLGGNTPSNVPFWQSNRTWVGIINNVGSGTLTGSFGSIDNSSWLELGYFSTVHSDNDVNLLWTSTIPEPSVTMLLGLGAFALLSRRSRSILGRAKDGSLCFRHDGKPHEVCPRD